MDKHLLQTLKLLNERFNLREELPPDNDEDGGLNVTSIPSEHPMLGLENCEDDELGEASNSSSAYAGGEGPQRTPNAFRKKAKIRTSNSYDIPVEETNTWFVAMEDIYKKSQKRILELNYNDYVADDSTTPRQKINSSIKEINKRLSEVEQMIRHSQKFKNEIGADSGVFYKDTINRFQKISERLMRISSKIREFNT